MPKKKLYTRWGQNYQDNRNWVEYNQQLVKRGEFCLQLDFLNEWDEELYEMNLGKVGRKYEYPERFIRWTAVVYHVMKMTYRTLEGFLRGLSSYITRLKAADYTTLFRRIRETEIQLTDTLPPVSSSVVVSVDTSGVKDTNRGEWLRHKWKFKKLKHKGWVKIHMAVDVNSKDILALEITDDSVGDHSRFKQLINQCRSNINGNRVEKVLADGAYDRRKVFNYLGRNRIKSGVKIRRNAKYWDDKSHFRPREVIKRNELGQREWEKEVGYGMRWASESGFSAVKRIMGEYVRSRSVEGALQEAYRKFVIYNGLKNFGKGQIRNI